MSTHAAIIEKTAEGNYRGIYLHYDGYPSHALEVLTAHYNTPEKVSELIDLGDLSCLYERPNPQGSHSYDGVREQGVCVAYHRDRGENLSIAVCDSLQEIKKLIDGHHFYLFADGIWKSI